MRAVVAIVLLGLLYLVFEQIGSGGAATVWPPAGYDAINSEVAFHWTTGGCAAGEPDGCWHALVVSRLGCSAELTVTLREARGALTVGEVTQDASSVAPLSPIDFEFDATTVEPLSGQLASAICF
jgi:hypothetical protein